MTSEHKKAATRLNDAALIIVGAQLNLGYLLSKNKPDRRQE
jgi:hypothetical protein